MTRTGTESPFRFASPTRATIGDVFPSVPDHVGYPALAAIVFAECAGLPIPGETALIVAAGLAAAGQLSLPAVILVAAAAAACGDTLGYWIGRRGGRPLLLRDGFAAG